MSGDDGNNDDSNSEGGIMGGLGSNIGERNKTSAEQFGQDVAGNIAGVIGGAIGGAPLGGLAKAGMRGLIGADDETVSVDISTGQRIGSEDGADGAYAGGPGGQGLNVFNGYNGANRQTFGSNNAANGNAIGGAIGGAVGEELQGVRESIAEQRRQFDIGQGNLDPFRQAGESALSKQQAFLGLSGQEAEQAAFDQFNESPGQAFLRKRGEKALLAGASATGGLGGGNVQSELQKQGIGFAQQQLNQHQAQLAGISGTGQSTAVTQAQLGSQFAGNVGQLQQGAAQSRASGLLAQQALEQQQATANSAASAARRQQNIGLATSLGSAVFDLF